MNVQRFSLTIVGLAAILLAEACGPNEGLADKNTPAGTLAIVHGTATATSGTSFDGPLLLSILWEPLEDLASLEAASKCLLASSPCTTDSPAWLQQAITYNMQFPFDFEIGIISVPPTEARYDLTQWGGNGTAAWGILVAFVDSNGNGRLDRGVPGVAGERVVGYSTRGLYQSIAVPSFELLYLDGNFGRDMTSPGFVPPQGFSMLSTTISSSGELTMATQEMSAHVQLDLSPQDPALQGLTVGYECEKASIQSSKASGVPAPPGVSRWCSVRGAICYSWGTYELLGPCELRTTSGSYCLAKGEPFPADWPCR
jgi:hypothetical protein